MSISAEIYSSRIAKHIEANNQVLLGWAGDTSFERAAVNRVYQAQRRILELAPDALDARVCDGRIIDGHGDLRPEHIYFNPHLIIIDCIEFNDEFRQLDILDELAFLAVECQQLGAPSIGDEIISHYQRTSRDAFPVLLLEFYKSYRACVRAKVLALRAKQMDTAVGRELHDAVAAYLQSAGDYAARLGPPVLIITYGLPGTGKSTLATDLAEKLGVEVLRSDEIRREVFHDPVASANFNEGTYEPAKRLAVYQEMFRRAEQLLAGRLSLVLDGTFSGSELRRQAAELAHRHGAVSFFVHCQCPPDVALERIASRSARGKSLSDATAETYQRLSSTFEPDPSGLSVCHIDTIENGTGQIREVFARLRNELLAS